jgi:hypothetical protein
MKSIASCLSVILAGTILLGATGLLATSRLEYCGQPTPRQMPTNAAMAVGSPAPTLAPPQSVVFVRVEADKPDLEVGWAN